MLERFSYTRVNNVKHTHRLFGSQGNKTFESVENGRPEANMDYSSSSEDELDKSCKLRIHDTELVRVLSVLEIQQPCLKNTRAAFASLLRTCSKNLYLSWGRQLHCVLTEVGIENHPSIENLLVQLYAKCRVLEDSYNIFDNMHNQNASLWNLIMSIYVHEGNSGTALQLFDKMLEKGTMVTKITYICMLSACAVSKDLHCGQSIHARIMGSHLRKDIIICTSLVNLYGICGRLGDAYNVFDSIEVRDVISWNILINVYTQHGLDEESLRFFIQMCDEGIIPNKVTFISMFNVCTQLEALDKGREIHQLLVIYGVALDIQLGTAAINMYGKCGNLDEAIFIFDKFEWKDAILWNSMISIYSQRGHCNQAIQLLDNMLLEGFKPTDVTYISIFNTCASEKSSFAGKRLHASITGGEFETLIDVGNAILNMYVKFCDLSSAFQMFQKIDQKNVVTWSSIIAAYASHGLIKEAVNAFENMESSGVVPNQVTLLNILNAFEMHANLEDLKRVHSYVMIYGLNKDVSIGTALIEMYSRCGSLDDAYLVFNALTMRDILCWTAIMHAHVQHRRGREALSLFNQMQKEGLIPDKVVLVNILAACSNLISVSECEHLHACVQQCNLEEDEVVGSGVISMYGRFGKRNLSHVMFEKLPKKHTNTWNAMIVVHNQHCQYRNAVHLFHQMIQAGVLPDKDTFVTTLAACAGDSIISCGMYLHAIICNTGYQMSDVLAGALINMYGKCGCLDIAISVFESMEKSQVILWNAIIGVHAQHGESLKALCLVTEMQEKGLTPDNITVISTLNACSHAGYLDEGYQCICQMEEKIGISPFFDHYACIIDLLRRLGQLYKAQNLINYMPFQPKTVSYMSLLGAPQIMDVKQGECAAKLMSELDPENAGPYVVLANIYAGDMSI